MEERSSGQAFRFGLFEVNLRTHELLKNGRPVRIQKQPFQVLAALLERPQQMVSREELRRRIWPADTFVDFENSLNVAVNRLREALNDSATNPHAARRRWLRREARDGEGERVLSKLQRHTVRH